MNWCWSWSSNTLPTGHEELTHLKRPWCWERLKAGGEGDNRGWDGWVASPTRWTRVWASSRSWQRTGKPGVLQSMESQSQTQLNDWTEPLLLIDIYLTISIIDLNVNISNIPNKRGCQHKKSKINCLLSNKSHFICKHTLRLKVKNRERYIVLCLCI